MKRILLFVLLLFTLGAFQAAWAQCYLAVENPGNLNTKAISQISLIQISQHFETVNEIPTQGISSDACIYNLSVAEMANGILVTIKGRKVSTFGDSKLRGFDGFRQSLFRAIISAKPEQRAPICSRYHNLMGSDCSDVTEQEPLVIAKGKLIVRVPEDHRYAQIFSSDKLLGEMSGETVKEFEVEIDIALNLKAKDGAFASEVQTVMAQPNKAARVDFNAFSPPKAPVPPPTPVIEKREEKDFGEDNPFIFGFSLTPVFSFSADDDIREKGTYRGLSVDKVADAIGTDFFIEFFVNENLGLGMKYLLTSAKRETTDGYFEQDIKNTAVMITATLWFPMNTKNRGYSHFGLTGGTGPATYKITDTVYGSVDREMEATGSTTMIGAFFDWGGDVFGGRFGYHSLTTNYGDLEDKTNNVTYTADLDGSGGGVYLSLRWAI